MIKSSIFEFKEVTMKPLRPLVFLFILLFLSIEGFAQYTDLINSNRPGVSRSAFSVGANVVQFEVGPYIIKEERVPTVRNEVSGFGFDYAIRYGLFLEELEINLEGTYQSDTKTTFSIGGLSQDNKRSNFKYNALGLKYLVYDPFKNAEEDMPNLKSWRKNRQFKLKSLIPAIAIYAGANFDTKDNPYTGEGVEGISPKIMIATQNNFAGGWVMVLNFIADRIGKKFVDSQGQPILSMNGEPLEASEFQYIVTITKSINEKLVVFGETQGINSDFYADNLFRFGGAYLIGTDFQLDTALTFNAKDTPTVFGVNFGMSYRLDFHKDKKPKNRAAKNLRKQKRQTRDELEKLKKKNKKTDFDDSDR